VFSKTYASTSRPAINKSSTVLDSFSYPVSPPNASSANGDFTVNATVTVQNGTTGSAQVACRFAVTGFISSVPNPPVGETPWNYETAVKGHPATIPVTGVLLAGFNAPSSGALMDVQCRASSGTNVHATNTTFVATPVAGRHDISPHNHFVHTRRTAGKR
jgi:hypothetical protein